MGFLTTWIVVELPKPCWLAASTQGSPRRRIQPGLEELITPLQTIVDISPVLGLHFAVMAFVAIAHHLGAQ